MVTTIRGCDPGSDTVYHQAPRDASWITGRSAELDLLDRHARAAAAGEPWIVLVEGDAGIGRTTLLRRFVSDEPDATVWWACCDPYEADLAYGLVSQFYRHVNRSVHQQHPWSERVPGAVAPADVGLHLLRVVEAAQQARPLVIVVDDAQWMDQPSLAACGYVLRRLEAARVLVVFAMRSVRPGGGQPVREVCDGLRRLVADRERSAVVQLGGLTAESVHELAEHAGAAVSMPVAIRLRDYVDGNPGHALDIVRRMRSDEPTAALGLFPVPDALAGETRRFYNGLAAPAGRLLAALAVLDGYHPLAVVAEIAGVPHAPTHLAPLLAGGLVRWWPRVPGTPIGIDGRLRRDAVYLSVDPELRRQLHATVAPRTDRLAALEHRIAASTGQDDELADELEQASSDRAVTADVDRVTTFLLCAADLTTERTARDRRLLRAAAALVCAWRWDRLTQLAPRIADCPPNPLRTVAMAALAHLAGRTIAAEDLVAAKDDTEIDDADRGLLVRAWLRLAASCASRDQGRLEAAMARRVLAEPDIEQPTLQRAACLAADADGRLGDGPTAALRTLEEMLAVPIQAGDPLEAVPLAARGRWQARAGRLTDAVRTLVALHERATDDAVGETAPLVHADLAFAHHLLGDWTSAGHWADVAVAEVSRRGTPAMRSYVYATAACVAAPAGQITRATELMLAARRWQPAQPPDRMSHAALAAATIAQAHADHPAMLVALCPVTELPDTNGHARYCQLWWRPLHAEALIGAGRLTEAADAVRRVTELAKRFPTLRTTAAWLRGWLAERLGEHDNARLEYESALAATAGPDDIALDRARVAHAYGLLLLTRGNRRLAITQLRQAFDAYSRLGAQPFLERCAADLADTGLRVSAGQSAGPLAVLSAKEHQVAHLVAAGLTNQQVAKEIYISVKTVEFHLGNIFTKLGITSRKDLGTLITGDAAGQGSANSSISLIATSGGLPPE